LLSFFSRLALSATLVAVSLPAASISGYSLSFNGVGVSAGDGNVNQASGGDGYEIDGTLGLFDQFGSQIALNTELTGPFSFRFTDAMITCFGDCGSTSYLFSVDIFFNGAAPLDADGVFGLEGSGSNGLLNANAFGSDVYPIANVSSTGNFSETVNLPSGFFVGNESQMNLAMFLTVDGMGDGDNVFLPNSLFQQVNLAGDNSVPEPGTLAIVGAGLAGAIWLRRRSR
jgi:hypothetical protein